jgi:pimeloyl-ACP methyl ester carboxylesterase
MSRKIPVWWHWGYGLAALLLVGSASAGAPVKTLTLSSCSVGGFFARCGRFVVYEDRAAGAGRTLALPLVVLPARHPNGRAVFYNPGGPGASAVEAAPLIAAGIVARELRQLRESYDIVLVDNRGIGGEAAQECDLFPPAHPEYYFLQLWPDALLRACRERLAAHADLSLYHSGLAADDLDDLRAALGYPRIVLDGASYGTHFYLVYMRQHPEHVESAILDGVAPPGLLIVPLEDAAGAQLAIDQLIASCGAEGECAAHFPHLAQHFAELARRFEAGPLEVRILNPATRKPQEVLLSKEVFADRLRQSLYGATAAAYVPYAIERAYLGDYVPLGQLIEATTRGMAEVVRQGANLSVTCAEELPFVTEEAVGSSSAGSFEGDARVRAQQRACGIWNVRAVPASLNRPVRSEAPVLLVSGSVDPTSPARFAAAALAFLPNARQVLVEGAAHVTETECTDRLKVSFVLSGSARDVGPDSCREAFHRPPFATSMAGLM